MARLKNQTRPDGRVKAKVYLGVIDGKKQYKYVYASTNKELEKKVQEIRLKLGKGLDVFAERDTFEDWAERWLKLKKTELTSNRIVAYRARVNLMKPLFNIPITKIRASDIQDIIIEMATTVNARTGKPYAKYTLNETKNVAAQIIQLAIDNRVLDYNCALAVKIPKNAEVGNSRRALTQEEQRWIIETPHRAQTAAMIMMFAGLRRGELLALTWADIDLKAKTIEINKSVEFINGKANIKEGGKTENATRTVYIPEMLAEYLEKIEPKVSFVCPSAKGTVMSDSGWKRLWESYLTDLNLKYGDWTHCIETTGKKPSKYARVEKPFLIPRITAHWLRHTYITMLYMAGVDILTAKEQAGHSDIKTTMEIYTHLDDRFKQKKLVKLDEYVTSNLGGSKGGQAKIKMA